MLIYSVCIHYLARVGSHCNINYFTHVSFHCNVHQLPPKHGYCLKWGLPMNCNGSFEATESTMSKVMRCRVVDDLADFNNSE